MGRNIFRLVIIGCITGLTACANFNTLNRSSRLPKGGQAEHGKAVHLDAQQRVVLINALGSICAEPSPDAMAAYAGALALGASIPGAGAGSLAGSQQSSVASIGLRTQSITLMRDALYRMCEAYANGAVGPAQIASLLGRSQDLTAVILAVEQLTGAVAANQVALTGTTSASASASLLSNQELLDAARKNETRKQAELEEAKASLTAAEKTRDEEEKNEAAAKAKLNNQPDNARAEDKARAKKAWEQSVQKLQRAQREVEAAENMVKTRETLLEEARRNRETIESSKDSALTSAAAGTTSSSQFSTPAARVQISTDKEATIAIASAVQAMVQTVLQKDYSQDSCMAMLTYIPRNFSKDRMAALKEVKKLCKEIVLQSITKQLDITANYGVDSNSERIGAWIKQDQGGNRNKLSAWLKKKKLNFSVTLLQYSAGNAGLRSLAIIELNIP